MSHEAITDWEHRVDELMRELASEGLRSAIEVLKEQESAEESDV